MNTVIGGTKNLGDGYWEGEHAAPLFSLQLFFLMDWSPSAYASTTLPSLLLGFLLDEQKLITSSLLFVLFSCQSCNPNGLQHSRLPYPSPSPGVCPGSCRLHQWYHPTISSSVALFSCLFSLSQSQGLFQWASCSHWMTRVLELQLQHQFFQRVFRVDFL